MVKRETEAQNTFLILTRSHHDSGTARNKCSAFFTQHRASTASITIYQHGQKAAVTGKQLTGNLVFARPKHPQDSLHCPPM